MSLFNLPPQSSTKPESIHPWVKIIKNEFANKIETVHNSVNNVVYPIPKEKLPSRHRVTFTVIGNISTKEFIYCVHLVRSMHKYKWKKFGAPVIRGCSEVEWSSSVLPDLKAKYHSLYCVKGQVAVLCNNKCIGGEKELKHLIETKYYTCLVALNYQKEILNQFAKFIKGTGRPCAYLHISINEKPIGSLIFTLYSDIVPRTCENFLRLCRSTSGGYSGTPVHRVVKDGWIQCGGFALKSTDLPCENFIVPHDRRGVLAMANDGRHLDCSTQFFVSLQPIPYLKFRFVAFGQLIKGEETLKKIEQVNTYYEAPTANITIYKAGVLNPDCRDIAISKGCQEYIEKHIDDLVVIGEMFYEMLLENVFLDIEYRMVQKLSVCEEDKQSVDPKAFRSNIDEHGNHVAENIHATRRFIRKRSEWPTGVAVEDKDTENNDFDVEDYSTNYEPEEYSLVTSSFNIPKAPKPYYLAMTDVPYPGEIDSNFDLKRFLQGNYCLEADINPNQKKIKAYTEIINSYGGLEMFMDSESSTNESSDEFDSYEELDLKAYIERYGDTVSFSGKVVKKVAEQYNSYSPLIEREWCRPWNDEELRRLRLALKDIEIRRLKHVSMDVEPTKDPHVDDSETTTETPIRSVSSADPSPSQPKVIQMLEEEIAEKEREIAEREREIAERESMSIEHSKEVKIVDSLISYTEVAPRKSIPCAPQKSIPCVSIEKGRPSVLSRLYDDVAKDNLSLPTLKDYKPTVTETKKKNIPEVLTHKSYLWRHLENFSSPQTSEIVPSDLATMKAVRAESRQSQAVNRIDAAVRPSLTVEQYQLMNLAAKRGRSVGADTSQLDTTNKARRKYTGLRLPGDSPVFDDNPTLSELPNYPSFIHLIRPTKVKRK